MSSRGQRRISEDFPGTLTFAARVSHMISSPFVVAQGKWYVPSDVALNELDKSPILPSSRQRPIGPKAGEEATVIHLNWVPRLDS